MILKCKWTQTSLNSNNSLKLSHLNNYSYRAELNESQCRFLNLGFITVRRLFPPRHHVFYFGLMYLSSPIHGSHCQWYIFLMHIYDVIIEIYIVFEIHLTIFFFFLLIINQGCVGRNIQSWMRTQILWFHWSWPWELLGRSLVSSMPVRSSVSQLFYLRHHDHHDHHYDEGVLYCHL